MYSYENLQASITFVKINYFVFFRKSFVSIRLLLLPLSSCNALTIPCVVVNMQHVFVGNKKNLKKGKLRNNYLPTTEWKVQPSFCPFGVRIMRFCFTLHLFLPRNNLYKSTDFIANTCCVHTHAFEIISISPL